MISFENVSYSYNGLDFILDNSTMKFLPGLTLLLGPNGCGKSTLLKLAAGVEKPDFGNIIINGHDIWAQEVAARRHLAYLPESPDLTPYATIKDILKLVWRLRGHPDDGIDPALRFFNLESQSHLSVRKLSKGQRRRAIFATLLIGKPDHILLDEPLEGMDCAIQEKILFWIKNRFEEGACIVVVSHTFHPFISMASHAVTIGKRKTINLQNLPPHESEKEKILEALARGITPSPRE